MKLPDDTTQQKLCDWQEGRLAGENLAQTQRFLEESPQWAQLADESAAVSAKLRCLPRVSCPPGLLAAVSPMAPVSRSARLGGMLRLAAAFVLAAGFAFAIVATQDRPLRQRDAVARQVMAAPAAPGATAVRPESERRDVAAFEDEAISKWDGSRLASATNDAAKKLVRDMRDGEAMPSTSPAVVAGPRSGGAVLYAGDSAAPAADGVRGVLIVEARDVRVAEEEVVGFLTSNSVGWSIRGNSAGLKGAAGDAGQQAQRNNAKIEVRRVIRVPSMSPQQMAALSARLSSEGGMTGGNFTPADPAPGKDVGRLFFLDNNGVNTFGVNGFSNNIGSGTNREQSDATANQTLTLSNLNNDYNRARDIRPEEQRNKVVDQQQFSQQARAQIGTQQQRSATQGDLSIIIVSSSATTDADNFKSRALDASDGKSQK